MKVVEFLKMGSEFLKMMSSFDLKRDDFQHIELYEEYMMLRGEGEKVDYILFVLSSKYKVSESTIKRVVKRFSREVK